MAATAIPSLVAVLILAATTTAAAEAASPWSPSTTSRYGWRVQYGDYRQRREVGSVAKTSVVVVLPSRRGRTARQQQRCHYFYDDFPSSSPFGNDHNHDGGGGGGGGRSDSDGRDGTDAARIATRVRGGGGGGEEGSNLHPGEDEVASATAPRGTRRRRGRRSDGDDDSRRSGRIRRSSKRHRGGGGGDGESSASASGTDGGTTTTSTTTTSTTALTTAASSSTSSGSKNNDNINPKQQQQQQQDFVGVTILCWGDIPTAEEEEEDGTGQQSSSPQMAFTPGCQLLSASPSNLGTPLWIGRGSWDDGPDPDDRNSAVALWKTVAFLSDVVVLVCRQRQPIPPALVQALEAGLTARLANRVPKGRLLMVLQCDDRRELRQWKSALERDLSRAVPGILQELRVVGDSEYRPALQDMIRRIQESTQQQPPGNSRGLCALVDGPSVVPALFRQVHRAFGGPDKKDLFRRQTDDLVLELAAPSSTAGASPSSAAAPTATTATVGDVEDMLQSPELVELERRILELSDSYLNDVQKQQEACWLENRVPINFASVVNTRLSAIQRQLKQHDAPVAIRTSVQQHVAGRVQRLYLQQLEALREQYGKMYESILDRDNRDGGGDDPDAWKGAAARVAERFRNAAERAVPPLCRPGRFFCPAVEGEGGEGTQQQQKGRQGGGDVWHYHRTVAESGLISDLMESTELRTDAIDLATEEDDVDDDDVDDILQDGDTTSKRTKRNRTRRPRWLPERVRIRPWQRKFLARALVLGVNYVQGWLAWQGIKRAAMLREQQMPKFPLF